MSRLAFLVLVLVLAAPARARYAKVDLVDVPLADLIAEYERRLAREPGNARHLAVLARLCAMAATRGGVLRVLTDVIGGTGDAAESVMGVDSPLSAPPVRAELAKGEEAGRWLPLAIRHYRAAAAAGDESPVTQLGLAWSLEQSGARPEATAAYRSALKAAGAEAEHGYDRVSVTIEAAHGLERLLDPATGGAEVADALARAEAVASRGARRHPISPIVIPLGRRDDLAALLAPDRSVAFDADGSDSGARWTWVTPDAGWLVWDPRRTGRITSGRQLFGDATFWVFWRDGYEVLSALDRDHDGRLAGPELAPLAIWRDADGDGVSDPGEVRPLAEHGVVALATRAGRHATGIPWAPDGARFADGRVRPTYDVMLAPAREDAHDACVTSASRDTGPRPTSGRGSPSSR